MMSLRYGLVSMAAYSAGSVGTILLIYAIAYLVFGRFNLEKMTFTIGAVTLAAVMGFGMYFLIARQRHRFSRALIGFAVIFSAVLLFLFFEVPTQIFNQSDLDEWTLAGVWIGIALLCSGPFLMGWLLTVLLVPRPPDMAGPEDVKAFE